MLEEIQECFKEDKVLYTQHAKIEMETEVSGEIRDKEVAEAIFNGEAIEKYMDDEPYPSILIYGKTKKKRPIHAVCAYSKEDDLAIVITVYEPDVKKWADYRRRMK